MDFLLAKIKKCDEILLVTSSISHIVELPKIISDECKPYNPRYKLEDEEWYKIENFGKTEFFNPLTHQDFSSTSLNQIQSESYSQIEYFCFAKNDFFIFQKMLPSQLMKKTILDLSDAPKILENKKMIVLHKKIDAIYSKNEDILFFRDFSKLKTFFRDIEILYREATEEEVNEFLSFDFIQTISNFTYKDIGLANRKRIALILDRVKTLQEKEKTTLLNYIHEYCSDITYKDKTFQISTEKQLRELLFGLEERYYTTLLDREKRLANSILKLS